VQVEPYFCGFLLLHSVVNSSGRKPKYVCAIPLQAKTLPAAVLGRRDILGAAETGSGKTLAFGIPILHRILEDGGRSAGRYSVALL
jgi:superfamily II DNA/RNA helicase